LLPVGVISIVQRNWKKDGWEMR